MQLGSAGGCPPYTWSLVGYSALPPAVDFELPSPFHLDTNGMLIGDIGTGGYPARVGDYVFGVRVTDANGSTAEAAFLLTVMPYKVGGIPKELR